MLEKIKELEERIFVIEIVVAIFTSIIVLLLGIIIAKILLTAGGVI